MLRISEAATKLGDDAGILVPNHPWRQIRDIGNVLRHTYESVDKAVIWVIVRERLPALLADVNDAASRLPDDDFSA